MTEFKKINVEMKKSYSQELQTFSKDLKTFPKSKQIKCLENGKESVSTSQ